MAMEFKPASQRTSEQQTDVQTVELMEVKEYDVVKEREQMAVQWANSAEIDSIVSAINAYDVNSVVSFGHQAADEISRVSDQVLNSMNMAQINESGKLLETLGKIMDQFDMQEIVAKEPKGLFGKLLTNMQKQIEKILAKYHTMGEQVDKVYVQLKSYEDEIKSSNKKLDSIFQANVSYYQSLVKYILAGEQAVKELDEHVENLRKEYEASQDNLVQLDITSMEQVREVLDQRVMDLKTAEHVAMQSIPMIKTMQYSNLNLIRKINSAFIITLPVFKQALTQAILLKRQQVQAQAMQALDERTNEMLLKNAQNTAAQSKLAAQMASGSSVKVDTLEKTWQTIVKGIEETKQIQEDAKRKRTEDAQRLNQLKLQYEQQAKKA